MIGSEKIFGRRRQWSDVAGESAARAPFGKRYEHVVDFKSVAKVRLAGICRDLITLYADPARCDAPMFEVSDEPDLCLRIGQHATVRIDEARGLYILTVNGRKPGTVTVETGSDDLLLDHIVCHLALDRGQHLSTTAHGLVSALVGHTLDDIERSLILATLRQHHFNRTRAAEVLGISVRTIRNKLKSYREGGAADAASTADIFRLRGSPPGG